MAKNKEAEPNTEKQGESAGSKILTLIIIILIVFIWLAILALLYLALYILLILPATKKLIEKCHLTVLRVLTELIGFIGVSR